MALRGEQVSPKPAPRYCAPWQVYPSFNAARYAAYTRAARSPRPSSPVATVAYSAKCGIIARRADMRRTEE